MNRSIHSNFASTIRFMVQSSICEQTVRCQAEMFCRSKSLPDTTYLPLWIRSSQKLCEIVLGKFNLTKPKQYFKQNSAMRFEELSQPGKSMLLAFLIIQYICLQSSSPGIPHLGVSFYIWLEP